MRTAVQLLCAVALLLTPYSGLAKDKKNKEAPKVVETFTADLDPEDGKKKPKKDQITQVLPLPKEPPAAVIADVSRLVFFSSDLSGKGLLSQQTREAIRTLLHKSRGATVLKIRAFVAGTGDLRRVQTIISEVFEEKRLTIPVVTTVQVGALPLEGAQVVLEAVGADRKVQAEHGVLFLSGHPAKREAEPDALIESLRKNGVEESGVQQVTCFLNRVDTDGAVKARLTSTFANASINVVQTQRLPSEMFEECEAVAYAAAAPDTPIQFKDGLPGSFSKVAIVGPQKVALSGLQLAFRNDDEDVRRAFTRLSKALEGVGAKLGDTVFTNFYPVTRSVADRARKLRFEFYNSANPPASTLLLFEGLPSNDAILGMEAIAVLK